LTNSRLAALRIARAAEVILMVHRDRSGVSIVTLAATLRRERQINPQEKCEYSALVLHFAISFAPRPEQETGL
jgi:hypothetical protein